MKNAKVILPTLALGLILGGVAVWKTGQVYANFGFGNKDNMTDQLSQKLNVSKDQVSSAIDQIQTENETKMKAEQSANLDKAVTDGAITAEQKQKILDEQAKLKQQQKDHRLWMTDSGIDWTKLKDYHIGIMGMGGKSHGWK